MGRPYPTHGAETAANRRRAGIWPEGQCPHGPIRPPQPGADRPSVDRERRAKHRSVRLDPAPVRVAVGYDDPDRDGRRRISWADPAAIDRDPNRMATLAVDGANQLVDIGDVGLQLDHEQGSQ